MSRFDRDDRDDAAACSDLKRSHHFSVLSIILRIGGNRNGCDPRHQPTVHATVCPCLEWNGRGCTTYILTAITSTSIIAWFCMCANVSSTLRNENCIQATATVDDSPRMAVSRLLRRAVLICNNNIYAAKWTLINMPARHRPPMKLVYAEEHRVPTSKWPVTEIDACFPSLVNR